MQRPESGRHPSLSRYGSTSSMASVVEFDHNQLPAFEDQNSKRQMESNRMEAIQLGKLRNQVSKLQNELKAAKRKVTQLNQQVGYQSGARGTSSLFNGEVVVRLVPQITASQQRTKRGQMTGHGGKGAIMFAPGSSLRPGVAVRSRLPPQPSAYMFVLIYHLLTTVTRGYAVACSSKRASNSIACCISFTDAGSLTRRLVRTTPSFKRPCQARRTTRQVARHRRCNTQRARQRTSAKARRTPLK